MKLISHLGKISGACALLIATSAALAQQSDCVELSNGGFQFGLEGWLIEPLTNQTGNAWSSVETTIVDGPVYNKQMSGPALMVSALASASGGGEKLDGNHFASAELVVKTPEFAVTQRYLTLAVGGGFEVISFGSANSSLSAHMAISPAPIKELQYQLGSVALPPFASCEWGMSVLGTFLQNQPVVIDLLVQGGQPTGIKLGDLVTLSITLQCSSSAVNSCDDGSIFGSLVLDSVQLCQSPPGTNPGDATGDGLVNVDDLLAVINAWGQCPIELPVCNGDLNGDLMIDVDDLLLVINNWA